MPQTASNDPPPVPLPVAGLKIRIQCRPAFSLNLTVNFLWQGMAVVAARSTRLPIYSSFAKEENLSDLFAKGEAISTLFNVLGIGTGLQLASTVCSSMQGKFVVGPLLSLVHIYCVHEETRATPS